MIARKTLALAIVLASLALVPAARADFGVSEFDVSFSGPKGEPVTQAGSHPYQMTTTFHFNSHLNGSLEELEGEARDIWLTQMKGFIGNPTAVPRCQSADFLTRAPGFGSPIPDCADSSAVGVVSAELPKNAAGETRFFAAIYDLQPPPGVAAKLGFWIEGFPVTVELGVEESPPYDISGGPTAITQTVEVVASTFVLWGNPADESHDPLRGHCLGQAAEGESLGNCPANISAVPFLTLPRACEGPLVTGYATDSWQNPGAKLLNGRPDLADPAWVRGFSQTHDSLGNPQGMSGCGKLGFGPEISARPTSHAATSPSGLDFSLDTENEGLQNPAGISDADIEKAIVTLPVGFVANPALAEGLAVCTEAQFKAETPYSAPGEGPNFAPPGVACSEAAKIGSVEVETPILEGKLLKGSLYIAKPYENPEHSLLALYMVIKDPELGIVIKVPFRITPDPVTGQLITTGEELPPFPFSRFRLHFREGGRSPLITPPGCGTFKVQATLYPSSGGAPVDTSSAFELVSGPNNSPCPSGPAPFHPGFEAGTNNNNAGSYSPFFMRLTRSDGEQDMTRFSSILPPGVLGKIAGIPWCPEAAIAQAKSRTGEHGGSEELAHPSCPAASKIGRTLAGAGVGSQLAYVPGSLYLAGPWAGDPLSVVAITPAVAGPFDAGTVVVREALTLNPVTGEVEVDGKASDPIPHILQGIPLNVRDLRVYADKPDFTLNATSCKEEKARATLSGGGTLLAPAKDTPSPLSARYQAADCASLGLKPQLSFKLAGGTRRGAHPALTATYTPRAGDANLEGLVARLPRSAFLDQAHIRTICTRVQFAAKACPPGSVYGHIKATTPLLADPLEGPVYLRSSNHNLPDLVFALHGLVDIEVATRIDSKNGGIRASIEGAPDAPITQVVLQMQGAKKGLIVNSRNLCGHVSKADVQFSGQNGKTASAKPVLGADCGSGRKRKRHRG